MARFSGKIGYAETVKTGTGKWAETITERHYAGDITRNIRRLESGIGVNDDVKINNEISVVADPYAQTHFFAIRYVEWQGVRWKVDSAEVLYPRLILTLGGLYHG